MLRVNACLKTIKEYNHTEVVFAESLSAHKGRLQWERGKLGVWEGAFLDAISTISTRM
jgi:hypothetical protein